MRRTRGRHAPGSLAAVAWDAAATCAALANSTDGAGGPRRPGRPRELAGPPRAAPSGLFAPGLPSAAGAPPRQPAPEEPTP